MILLLALVCWYPYIFTAFTDFFRISFCVTKTRYISYISVYVFILYIRILYHCRIRKTFTLVLKVFWLFLLVKSGSRVMCFCISIIIFEMCFVYCISFMWIVWDIQDELFIIFFSYIHILAAFNSRDVYTLKL